MGSMKNWMLGAAVVAGGLGLGAAPAQAAEFGVYMRGPVAYVPPCPGPGYFWVAGYKANGYWIPGRWNFVASTGAACPLRSRPIMDRGMIAASIGTLTAIAIADRKIPRQPLPEACFKRPLLSERPLFLVRANPRPSR